MQRKDALAWASVLIGSALTAAVLFAYYHATTGHWFPAVLPQVEEDTLYYLAQVKSVLNGHPFLGNPYIREYAGAFFPGLILPVWLSAIPGFFGLGINVVYAVDAFLFSILTGLLFYAVSLRLSGGKRMLSVATSIAIVASLHNLLIRPAIMQTVYPAFAFFLLGLYAVLAQPRRVLGYVLLGASCILAFYLYTFLWMVAFTASGLLVLIMAWRRDWPALLRLAITGAVVIVACLPQILNTASLFQDAQALAIVARTGLVQTHRVLPLTITNLKYTILLLAVLSWIRTRRSLTIPETFLILMGGSLLIGALSNVVTGKEMDFDTHFWRFELPMNILAIAALLPGLLRHQRRERIILGCLCAALLCTTVNRIIIRANSFRYPLTSARFLAHRSLQEEARVFGFFNGNGLRNQVILANAELSTYIPIYTDNFVFYHYRAALHVIPDAELRTRFLAANANHVDEAFLRNTIASTAGISVMRTAQYLNAYGGNTQPVDLAGGEAFLMKLMNETESIRRTYEQVLKKFGVTYVIVDTMAKENPDVPVSAIPAYHDDRFTVYHLP